MRAMIAVASLALSFPFLSACSTYRESGEMAGAAQTLESQALAAIGELKAKDPSIQKFFDNAYAYVVFPKVAKGAVGVGAANGEGVFFEQGAAVGLSEMTQVTVGFQLGGQTYTEIIFFQSQPFAEVFKSGSFEFSANASAVAVESGAAASNDFSNGLAVFTMPRGGLMFEASVGGQKFTYRPLGN